MKIPIITIDGPSGSGKGCLSQALAARLGWNYLDSGLVYRYVALAVSQHQIDITNEAALIPLITILDFTSMSDYNTLRTEQCAAIASKLAVLPGVRTALLHVQRSLVSPPGLIADGRDMGTVIFPDADIKIYLEASPDQRATRRYEELRKRGLDVKLKDIFESLVKRDDQDKGRLIAPLLPASDAMIIDTTQMSKEQVLDKVLGLMRKRLLVV